MDPVTLTLQPGQNGTKQLASRYGEKLICVRHRKDAFNRSYKTIELVIPDDLLLAPDIHFGPEPNRPPDVFLRIHWNELELRECLKRHGARWISTQKCWQLDYRTVAKLGLEKRVVSE